MNHNGINILTRNGDVPHRECTSSPGMQKLTENAHSLYRVCSQKSRVDFALHSLGQTFNWVVAPTAHIPGFGSIVSNPNSDLLTSNVKNREHEAIRCGKSAFKHTHRVFYTSTTITNRILFII